MENNSSSSSNNDNNNNDNNNNEKIKLCGLVLGPLHRSMLLYLPAEGYSPGARL